MKKDMDRGVTPEEAEVRRRFASNELYKDFGPGLESLEETRIRGKELADEFNLTSPRDSSGRRSILEQLFGRLGDSVWIEPPLHVAYGKHTFIGSDVYANFGLTLVDDSEVEIGNRVMFGPNVTISTAGHPLGPVLRATGQQFSSKVTIGDDAWLGAGAVVLPGVTIGAGAVVAAGSVVNANVPPMVVVGGVPARIIREITDEDEDWRWRPVPDMKWARR